jgi:hypothetical protein
VMKNIHVGSHDSIAAIDDHHVYDRSKEEKSFRTLRANTRSHSEWRRKGRRWTSNRNPPNQLNSRLIY